MKIQHNMPLAPLTSLGVGGNAETLVTIESAADIEQALRQFRGERLWVLGYGTNSLISDQGLPGVTLLMNGGQITRDGTLVVADSGVWWDDLVQYAIELELWGLELMSAIPGGVGASVVGNVAAYGQAVSDTLAWVEVIDTRTGEISRLMPGKLGLEYRYSAFQAQEFAPFLITRAAFNLSLKPTTDLTYQSAIDVAEAEHFDVNTLSGRHQTILKARDIAGSLWDYRDHDHEDKTAGSFFRNPIVSPEQADMIMSFDETHHSLQQLRQTNLVHGGNAQRVSAALVMLAAGFERGQSWGPVRLHPKHVLKIENTGGATAQQIYDVAQEIVETVKQKLGITLAPEPRFLGEF